MELAAAMAQRLPRVPMSDTLAFNDAHQQHMARHLQGADTVPVGKARMLARIAQDQAAAGIRFEGQRTPLQARLALGKAERAQASQALRLQSPLGYAVQGVRTTVEWASSLFSAAGLHGLNAAAAARVLESQYVIEKSPAFERLEQQGGPMRNVVIAYMDRDHGSAGVEAEIRRCIKTYCDVSQGDFVLREFVSYDGKRQQTPQDIGFDCNVPQDHCGFLIEPESTWEVVRTTAVLGQNVQIALNHLLRALPRADADRLAAERKVVLAALAQDNEPVTTLHGLFTKFLPFAIPKAIEAGTPFHQVIQRVKAQNQARIDAANQCRLERDVDYWTQVADTVKQLRGGNLLLVVGNGHGPEYRDVDFEGKPVAEGQGVPLSVYRGDEVPIVYLKRARMEGG